MVNKGIRTILFFITVSLLTFLLVGCSTIAGPERTKDAEGTANGKSSYRLTNGLNQNERNEYSCTMFGGNHMSNKLKDRSVEIILNYQHPNGAYVACPNFNTYKYCWLRDGSFIGYSMDISGQHESAERFLDWVDGVIKRQGDKVREIIDTDRRNEPLLNSDYLPTRYTLEGQDVEDEWPNFQLDGYGTWLWALAEHIDMTGNVSLIEKYNDSIRITIDYLSNFYSIPNFDCWEENGDKVHTSTLSCIYGGLKSISAFPAFVDADEKAEEIKRFVLDNCVKQSRFMKYVGTDSVDASLLWTALPFKLVDVDDEIMKNTVALIEADLFHKGGVHRYAKDTYYGGGEWILLSCWLGWYYSETGEIEKAKNILAWVERKANEKGELPEQILEHVNEEGHVEEWRSLWGDVATPLLWSHAMYLILERRATSGHPLLQT